MSEWLDYLAACMVVIGLLSIAAGVQEYLEWRKGK
jgi:hypothetical protein